MKYAVIFTVVALLGLAFGCEKDSLTGFSNEEAGWRMGEEGLYQGAPKMATIKADYLLLQAKALPNGPSPFIQKPPKGAKVMMYGMRGKATFMGKLDEGMSYEVHFLPPGKNPAKDTFDVWVQGIFMGSTDLDCLKYTGTCLYYPDGRRDAHYEFVDGTGPFAKVRGWIAGHGFSDNEGQYMKFEIEGKITMPPLKN